MKVKIELTNGEIKEYEVENYIELMEKLQKDQIKPNQLKKIIQ